MEEPSVSIKMHLSFIKKIWKVFSVKFLLRIFVSNFHWSNMSDTRAKVIEGVERVESGEWVIESHSHPFTTNCLSLHFPSELYELFAYMSKKKFEGEENCMFSSFGHILLGKSKVGKSKSGESKASEHICWWAFA